MEQSKRFNLNINDIERWARNGIIFFAPALLVFLLAIQGGATLEEASVVLEVWLLNTTIDLLRKFIAGNK